MKTTLIVFSLSLCEALNVIGAESEQSAAAGEFTYHQTATLPFYVEVNPGVTWIQNTSFAGNGGGGTIQFNPGPRVDFVFGYNLNETMSVELEAGLMYAASSSSSIVIGDFEGAVQVSQYPVMVNLRYQLPVHSRWHSFVGVGLGGVYTTVNQNLDFLEDVTVGHDFTFGYQAFAGVRYEFARHFEMGLEYKFMGTTGHDLVDVHMDPTYSHSLAFVFSFPF